MRYYEKHIGDFNNSTRHFSRIERSIYQDLIELYYDKEQPLPNDLDWIHKHVLAHTDEEKKAVEFCLDEKFTLENDVWMHERCEMVLAEYLENSQKADEKRENEARRKREYRARRKELLKKLKELGETPSFNTPQHELEKILSDRTSSGQSRQGTATQQPTTTTQQPSTKEPVEYVLFSEFWKIYPKKIGKKDVEKKWKKLKVTDELFAKFKSHVLVAYLETEKQFIPNASTYLNQERCEDEIIQPQRKLADVSKVADDDLLAFADKLGLPGSGTMTYFEYRQFLKREIEAREIYE